MKAFLGSHLFLILVALAICVDHLIDGILAHSYKHMIVYGILSAALFLALIVVSL